MAGVGMTYSGCPRNDNGLAIYCQYREASHNARVWRRDCSSNGNGLAIYIANIRSIAQVWCIAAVPGMTMDCQYILGVVTNR